MIESYGVINDRAPHLVADLCEIICYFGESGGLPRRYLRHFSLKKVERASLLTYGLSNLDSAEVNERFQELSEEVFRHLTYRARAFTS